MARRRLRALLGLLCLGLLQGCAAPTPLPRSAPDARASAATAALQATHHDGAGRWRGAGYWNTANAFSVVLDE